MNFDLPDLPIHKVLPKLQTSLATHPTAILEAEPGSGKTTIVPLVLADASWLNGKKIIMLEPRRIAARMAARRLSELAGDRVGGLVGYRIRFDRKISSKTRIEVVTEGILTRMIQNDPGLSGVGLVIFDEFHERSLQSDLALALCNDVQQLRDNLKMLIMSATMDSLRIAKVLGDAPVISGKGRCFPVSVHYLPRPSTATLIQLTVQTIHKCLKEHSGDILVFLPGAGAIKAVQRQITTVNCLPLYGNLPQKQQDIIFSKSERQRVILATPIAETSLTIEGISVVIDSGLVKIPRYSPTTGLTTLDTRSISRASADQRSGRAGRLGPGTCHRLWTEAEQHSKTDFLPAEIIGADLSSLLLDILQWGVSDPAELTWMDPPRNAQVQHAGKLLASLGAIDSRGVITDTGRQLASLPLHPRLALMLLRGRDIGQGSLACRLAALLQQRDLFRGRTDEHSVDIEERLDLLRLFKEKGANLVQARGGDSSLCRRVLQEAKQYQQLLGIKNKSIDPQEAGNLLAFAYPDRIAMKKPGSRQHILASGRGVLLGSGDHLHHADFLVAAHLDGGRHQGRIYLGVAITEEEIKKNHSLLLKRKQQVKWNSKRKKVEAVSILSLGSLELETRPWAAAEPQEIVQCLLGGIQEIGIDCLGWDRKSRSLQARMQSAHYWDKDNWPDVSDSNLINDLVWLEPYLGNMTSIKQLHKIHLYPVLLAMLSWQEQQRLDSLLPTHFKVPSGTNIPLIYEPGKPPVLAARLQQMFGATTTPTVFGGKVPILIHLLSPAGRPVQVTSDLIGFWQTTYYEVKKELKGRYPKHYWPDDPHVAQATNRVRGR